MYNDLPSCFEKLCFKVICEQYRFICIHKGPLNATAGSEVWTKQSEKKCCSINKVSLNISKMCFMIIESAININMMIDLKKKNTINNPFPLAGMQTICKAP